MNINNIHGSLLMEKSHAFEELKKYHIDKITLDVKESSIIIEMEKDREGDIRIFLIESKPNKESQSTIKPGFRSKEGRSFFEEKEIVNVPFLDVLGSINLNLTSFIGYFSDMTTE